MLDSFVLKVLDTCASTEEAACATAEFEVSAGRRTMLVVLTLLGFHVEENAVTVNYLQICPTVYVLVIIRVYEKEVLQSQFYACANAARAAIGAVHAVSLCAKERKGRFLSALYNKTCEFVRPLGFEPRTAEV